VALVHRLEESHLGVTRQVDILSAVSDELHESTGHLSFRKRKKQQEAGSFVLCFVFVAAAVVRLDERNV
jgi:hypothetical protein